MSEDHAWLGIGQLASAFREGRFTPTEHLEHRLARIEVIDPRLCAFILVDREGARRAAAEADARFAAGQPLGLLDGVPIGIKDVIDVAGLPTTCHSRLMPDHPAASDAAVVAALRAGGAVIVGKLATHEFAIGGPSFDLPYPPARNPWNLDHHPGGSSSGAGAAVAAGLVAGAVGTDTAGSVRNPAGACGVVGLKPTLGSLPRDGVFPLAWSLDHVGALARSVVDARLLHVAMGGHAPALQRSIKGLRIGFVRHFHERDMIAEPETAAALDRVAGALEAAGAQVVTVELPPLELFATINRVVLQAEGFALHAANMRHRPMDFAATTRAALLPGAFTTAEDYLTAQRRRSEVFAAVEAVFGQVDALLCANSMEPSCRIDDPAEIARSYMLNARAPFNVTGHPALAMMAGLSAGGLPLSAQFAARRDDEATLLGVAAAWEAAMGPLPRPPLTR